MKLIKEGGDRIPHTLLSFQFKCPRERYSDEDLEIVRETGHEG
jgi:hypothetical protein